MPLPRILKILWTLIIGTVLCALVWTSVIALGWSYRLMQREALRVWWDLAGKHLQTRKLPREQRTLHGFLKSLSWGAQHTNSPNWFARQRLRAALREEWPHVYTGPQRVRLLVDALTASLRVNLRIGVLALLNTWVLTLAPAFAWVGAWHVTRLSQTGQFSQPLGNGEWLVPLGALLYALAMTLLPLAQARQAVTGDWRAFYQASMLFRLIRHYRGRCMALALCYIAASLPLIALLTRPELLPGPPGIAPWLAGLTSFGLMTGVRLTVARSYARMIVDAVAWGEIELDQLHPRERELLNKLSLHDIIPEEPSEFCKRWVDFMDTMAGNVVSFVVLVALWLVFVAGIHLTEQNRFNAHRNLVNFALVQLPATTLPDAVKPDR